MCSWYVDKGFLDAKVVKQEYVDLGGMQHELIVTLYEGPQCYVASMELDSFVELSDKGPFFDFVGKEDKTPFTMDHVQEVRQWLFDNLTARGYRGVQVKPEFNRSGSKIAIVWKIITNESHGFFGKTVVLGSSTFPFEYIQRELLYKQGDPWDPIPLKASLRKLKQLEIFDTIHLYPYGNAHLGQEHPIVLKIQNDDPFELRMRSGFAIQQLNKELVSAGLTYRIGGDFFIKNPFNCADQVHVEVDVDRSQQTCIASYSRPWIFDKPIGFLLQGHTHMYQQPGLTGKEKNLYEVIQQGFLCGFTKTYATMDTSINTGIEFIETRIQKNDDMVTDAFSRRLAHALNFEPHLLGKKIPYFLCEPSLIIDYTDQKLQPNRGASTLLTVKGLFPCNKIGADSYVIRLLVEQALFMPWRSLVAALRVRFGYIFHRELAAIVPTERFYLGGANSIRSYETDRCPPLGRFEQNGCVQWVPQGGKSMINVNGELRFPIFKNVNGALFQDLGFLSGGNVVKECSRAGLLAGTGFGVRYATPLGPLRFDIAWKWRHNNLTEHSYAWFLTFGHVF